jgi:hypothetical protein
MKNPFNRESKSFRQKSNVFDLSYAQTGTYDMGNLYPVLLQEIVPGDRFRVKSEIFMRLAPLVAPILHDINVYLHYFFVPNRIVWENWEDFITGGEDGTEAPTFPTLSYKYSNLVYLTHESLAHHFGLPDLTGHSGVTNGIDINALPFRGYQMIFNEFYRDQQLRTAINFDLDDDADSDLDVLTPIRRRSWEKDYFTSALPWTQRGTDLQIPIEVDYLAQTPVYSYGTTAGVEDVETDGAISNTVSGYVRSKTSGYDLRFENIDETTSGIDPLELRRIMRLQEFLERNARFGGRYVEQLLGRFGVRLPDYTLQRPQYLGGGRQPVRISEVLNTSATATEEQGNMSGHGISVGVQGFSSKFLEHGYVIGILSVIPRTSYQHGIPKTMVKSDKFDFFTPEFAHLGEQEVYDYELWFPTGSDIPTTTFGYQQRYAEYKYNRSYTLGEFADTLDHWTLTRQFSSQPSLNSAFVESNPRYDIFADHTSDYLWVQTRHDIKAIRPIPYFGEPKF